MCSDVVPLAFRTDLPHPYILYILTHRDGCGAAFSDLGPTRHAFGTFEFVDWHILVNIFFVFIMYYLNTHIYIYTYMVMCEVYSTCFMA